MYGWAYRESFLGNKTVSIREQSWNWLGLIWICAWPIFMPFWVCTTLWTLVLLDLMCTAFGIALFSVTFGPLVECLAWSPQNLSPFCNSLSFIRFMHEPSALDLTKKCTQALLPCGTKTVISTKSLRMRRRPLDQCIFLVSLSIF